MPIDSDLAALNKIYKSHAGLDWHTAYLGTGDGIIYDSTQDGNVFVRFPASDGNLTAPVSVRLRASVSISGNDSQQPVKVGRDKEGKLAVLDIDFEGTKAHGGSPLDANAADKRRNAYTPPENFIPLDCHSTSAPGALTTEVYVNPLVYIVDNTVHFFYGELVDLAAAIPAAGFQRLACLFLKTDDTIETVTSTQKTTIEVIGDDDVQECLDGATPGAKPAWAWLLANGAASLSDADRWLDLRQRINAANVAGLLVPPVLIDGNADVVQLTVQGDAGQASNLFVLEQSDGTDVFSVDDDGDTTIAGHLAVGANAALDANHVVVVDENTTDPGATFYGYDSSIQITASGGPLAGSHATMRLAIKSDGGQNFTGAVIGQILIATHAGTATAAVLTAAQYTCNNTAAGTVTEIRNLYINAPTNTGGGTVTRAMGLRIGDVNVAGSNWAIRTYAGNIVFNEDGDADTDMRVEGFTDVNLLFVNAGDDTVQVGAAAAADGAKFYVAGKISASGEVEINGPLNHDGASVGFYGTAPAVQQDVAGARDNPEAALANLLIALANIGIITDSTTAS